jgi:Rrf2 family iron-sulfur cluster assembly transcriptional regulator
MLDVALHDNGQPVRIAEIAERQGISQSYLEQLFANLKKNGLVCGRRGPGGGYKLSRKSKLITVADVIDAVNERVDATRCGGLKNCTGSSPCLTHDLWADLS